MSNAPTTEPQSPARQAAMPAPFTVQFGDDYCSNFRLPIIGITIRGEWSQSRMANRIDPDNRTDADGKPRVIGMRSMGEKMHAMPDFTGTHVTIDARRQTVTLSDPLRETKNKSLFERASRVLAKAAGLGAKEKYDLPHTQEIGLPQDRFKTFVREIFRFEKQGVATVVKGEMPTMAAIDRLPGDYLYDPDGSGRKPKYEKDVDQWLEKLDAVGA